MNKQKWIFFDIGSTLVDESVAYQNRIKMTIIGSNITYNEFMDRFSQSTGDFKSVCTSFGLKPAPWNSDDEVVYPEAENCLRVLSKHYKIGIIANQNLGSKERLEKLGLLKYIDLVIASAEEGVAKPDLRIFQIALDRANCKPEEAVMVGDRLDNDIVPANKIGMTTVWIKQGFGCYAEPKGVEEQPDYIVYNLDELLKTFEIESECMTNWNPIQYEKFIKDRTQPAIDLANRLETPNPMSIIDLGCGSGNSTKVLKDKFPNARVVGADNSEEMLSKARELYPNIEFIHLDANGDLNGMNEQFDIVFSNACIQWLPNHRELLPKLMKLLKPNGTLAVQIPLQAEHPVHIIINELVNTAKWSDKLIARKYNNLTTSEYYDVLSDISSDFEIWETTYCHRMPSYESIIEWYKGTGLRPYLEQLSEADADKFVGDVYNELKHRYKIQKNGEILFRFPRLFFIVKKS